MTLRGKLVRLAHENPELRPLLIPILKEAAIYLDAYKAARISSKLGTLPHEVRKDFVPHPGATPRVAIIIADRDVREATRAYPNLLKLSRTSLGRMSAFHNPDARMTARPPINLP